MKLPANAWQNLSPPQKIIFILASLCVVGLIALAVLVLELRSRQQAPLPQAGSALLQECQPSTLVLGETTFQIRNLNRAADGSLSVPQDTSGIAYRVEGTNSNPIFVLSPTPQNLSIVSTINIGSAATATWSDCSFTQYHVTTHEPGSFDGSTLRDQALDGMKIYFPIDASGAGFVFTGELSREGPAPAAANAAPTTGVNPTIVIPTQDCGPSKLVLGTATFKIKNLPPAADGSLTVPPDTSGIAYQVEGTDTRYVFVLSPMPQNLAAMDTITVGSPATVTWPDCSSTSYTLSAPQEGSFDGFALPDQSQEEITIFFQTDPSGASFVFRGELAEEVITTIDTPMPDESGVLAEIGLLEITTAPDGGTIKISVSIGNFGATAFTISPEDASLTQSDGNALALASSKPGLPRKINPGNTEIIELSFPHPSTPTATLKIFTVEYDIDGY